MGQETLGARTARVFVWIIYSGLLATHAGYVFVIAFLSEEQPQEIDPIMSWSLLALGVFLVALGVAVGLGFRYGVNRKGWAIDTGVSATVFYGFHLFAWGWPTATAVYGFVLAFMAGSFTLQSSALSLLGFVGLLILAPRAPKPGPSSPAPSRPATVDVLVAKTS